MTIKELKESIKDLPDSMRVYADDGMLNTFDSNTPINNIIWSIKENKCVLQIEGGDEL